MMEEYNPVSPDKITIKIKNGIPNWLTRGEKTPSIPFPTLVRSHGTVYVHIMTNMKSSATYNPYFSQNFPKSMKPPYKGLPEDVRHIRSGKIQQVIGIGDDPYSTPGHHRVGRGDRPVELLVLGNRPRTLFVPAPRFVGHAPHKDLVIIRFNKDDHVGHDLAEHPFGEPGEISLGGFHRSMGVDQNVSCDPGNRLGRALLEPFLVGPVK